MYIDFDLLKISQKFYDFDDFWGVFTKKYLFIIKNISSMGYIIWFFFKWKFIFNNHTKKKGFIEKNWWIMYGSSMYICD